MISHQFTFDDVQVGIHVANRSPVDSVVISKQAASDVCRTVLVPEGSARSGRFIGEKAGVGDVDGTADIEEPSSILRGVGPHERILDRERLITPINQSPSDAGRGVLGDGSAVDVDGTETTVLDTSAVSRGTLSAVVDDVGIGDVDRPAGQHAAAVIACGIA